MQSPTSGYVEPRTSVPDLFVEPGTAPPQSVVRMTRRIVTPIIAVGFGAASFLGTLAPIQREDIQAIQRRLAEKGTSSGRLDHATPKRGILDQKIGMKIAHLRSKSGLTTGEIAAAVGVSRRAVHHWVSGGRISDRHATRLGALIALVQSYSPDTAANIRSHLLSLEGEGTSPLQNFMMTVTLERRPLSTQSLTGILEGEDAPGIPSEIQPRRRSTMKPRTTSSRGGSPSE